MVESEDLQVLSSWWAGLAPDVPGEVRGLWFGIVDLIVDGGPVRHLYVAGCPEFDPDDGGDWACDHCWWPENRYVRLAALGSLPDQPYEAVLSAAVALVRALRPAEARNNVEGVGVGFDDGDIEIVWTKESQ